MPPQEQVKNAEHEQPKRWGAGNHPVEYFKGKTDEEILKLSGIGPAALAEIRAQEAALSGAEASGKSRPGPAVATGGQASGPKVTTPQVKAQQQAAEEQQAAQEASEGLEAGDKVTFRAEDGSESAGMEVIRKHEDGTVDVRGPNNSIITRVPVGDRPLGNACVVPGES